KEQRKKAVEKDPDAYVALLAGAESGKSILDSASRRGDIIQYILALAGDLIKGEAQAKLMGLYLGWLTLFTDGLFENFPDAPELAKALADYPESYKPLLPLL